MPNAIYRNSFIAQVEAARTEYRLSAELPHKGFKGLVREIAVRSIFRPALPRSVEIGTGHIIDSSGAVSGQTDIVIYSPDLIPPLLYDPSNGLFPVEACFCAIEVKSRVDNTKLTDPSIVS